MNLADIRSALKDVLDGVDGVRGYDYTPGTLVTSSAGSTAVVVMARQSETYVDYLEASQGGQVQVHVELRVYVQLVDLASAQRRLDELLSAGTGEDRSLFDAIRANNDLDGTVMDCAPHSASGPEEVTVGEVRYLAASLNCLILARRT